MAIDTYSALQTEVGSWLQRSDLAGSIPTFIEFATAHFNEHLRVPQMEQRATSTLDGEFVDLPDDFLQLRYIELSTGERLRYVTPEQYADEVEQQTRPEIPVYTIADMSFRFHPVPTATDAEIIYYKMIPDFVNASDTNWLLDAYPNAYLAASLMYGFDFLHDDARAAKWEQRTQQHIARIQRAGKRLAQGAASMTIKVV